MDDIRSTTKSITSVTSLVLFFYVWDKRTSIVTSISILFKIFNFFIFMLFTTLFLIQYILFYFFLTMYYTPTIDKRLYHMYLLESILGFRFCHPDINRPLHIKYVYFTRCGWDSLLSRIVQTLFFFFRPYGSLLQSHLFPHTSDIRYMFSSLK